MSPPASPRTNRLRQVMRRARPVRVRVRMSVAVAVLVILAMTPAVRHGRAHAPSLVRQWPWRTLVVGRRAARRRISPASIHPPMTHDRDRGNDRRPAHDGVRARRHPSPRPRPLRARGCRPCGTRSPRPRARAHGAPSRVSRRGRPPSASCRGPASVRVRHRGRPRPASDSRTTSGVRSAARKMSGSSVAADATRHDGRRRLAAGRWRRRDRRRRSQRAGRS